MEIYSQMVVNPMEDEEGGQLPRKGRPSFDFRDQYDVTRYKAANGRIDYNRDISSMTDFMDALKISRLQDPLSVLPPELWLHCLAEVVDNNSINLLPLLLVCKKWRDLLVSAAPLWTNIYVRDNTEYADCTHAAIRLSQKLPLSVTIEIPLPPSAFPHPIWWDAPRIRDLTFKRSPRLVRSASTTDVGAMDEFYDAIFELLTPLRTLPMLEFLTILHHFDYYSLSMTKVGFPVTPMLKGIKFWCLPVTTLGHLNSDELTYLSSSSPLPELYLIMPRLRRLKRLILTQAGDCQEDSPTIPIVDFATLPRITALEFYQSSPQAMRPFLEVANSAITELQIKVSWAEFGKLAPKFGNLPLLRHLHIILRAPKTHIKGFDLLLPSLKQVRKFEVEQQPYENDNEATVSELAIGSMLDACRASLPEVDSFLLVLHDTVPTSNLLHCIQSLHKLRKFEFKGKLRQEPQPPVITKDTLEEVILSSETLLLHLYIPNALEIYVATTSEKATQTQLPSDFRLEAPKLRTLSLHADHRRIIHSKIYPELKHLTWIDPRDGCAIIAKSFNSLTKISFDSTSPRKECNDFCEMIMRFPASCPALETIEMRAYPEWDLLFFMLIRRNIDRPKDRSEISTLKLPGYPGVSLLVPITELLGGRFPKTMPSVSELSLIAVDAPYFDPDV
jgi:hypothetical protein